MKIPALLKAAPATILVVAVIGSGLLWVLLGSFGLISDSGTKAFTTRYYVAIFPAAIRASALSLTIAGISTVIAVLIGLAVAATLHTKARSNRFLSAAIATTVSIPHLVAAVAIYLLLGDAGWLARLFGAAPGSWPQFVAGPWWLAVILDYAWKESAFVALVVLATLPPDARKLDNVATTLGFSPIKRLVRVFTPLAAPGLIAAGGLSFIYAFGSYEVSWLLGRTYPEPLSILAFRLFSSSDLAIRPQALAASSVSLVLSLVAAGGVVFLLRSRRIA